MANWCRSRLSVTGDPEQLTRWLAAQLSVPADARDPDQTPAFTFSASVPVPPQVLAQSGMARARSLAAIWGTRTDALHPELHGNPLEGGVMVTFSTANSPPDAWLLGMATSWPGLTFVLSYLEPGMPIAGTIRVKGGAGRRAQVSTHTPSDHELSDWG